MRIQPLDDTKTYVDRKKIEEFKFKSLHLIILINEIIIYNAILAIVNH